MNYHNNRPHWMKLRAHAEAQKPIRKAAAKPPQGSKPPGAAAPRPDPAKLLAAADAARDARDWTAAVEKYQEYLAQQPQAHTVWVQIGHALKEAGDHPAAEAAYRRAIDRMADPTDPELHLAYMLNDAGRPDEARHMFEKVEQAMMADPTGPSPRHADLVLLLGDLARDRRDWLAAAKYYETFLGLRPGASDIWVQLGHARKETGHFSAAKAAYQKACATDPAAVDALRHLVHLSRRLQDTEGMANAYARMLEIDPSATEPYLELAGMGCRDLAYASVMRTAPSAAPTRRIAPAQEGQTLAIFTIACSNYLSHVRTFVQSAKQQYPEARIFFCLAERELDPQLAYPEDCEIILAPELGIQRFNDFAFRYDIMEFNTALKPFVFRFLAETLGFDITLYFDPDIEIFRRSEGVLQALRQGASFVLTPHLIEPAGPRGEPDDVSILRSGVFNLGFMGMGRNDESERLLQWWSRHLQFQCVNEPETGVFVDQKFIDLLPCLADKVVVHRNPAANLAYWNLSERRLTAAPDGWFVNERPLEFFHYSGFDPRTPGRLSKHTRLFSQATGDLAALLASYAHLLQGNDDAKSRHCTYTFGCFGNGTPISSHMRVHFRRHHLAWPSDPFETYDAALYSRRGDDRLPPLARYFWDKSAWLQGAFDPGTSEGLNGYAEWFEQHASRDLGLDEVCIKKTARSLRTPQRRPAETKVCVATYLTSVSGMGEGGRRMAAAMAASGRGVEACDITETPVEVTWKSPLPLVRKPGAPIELYKANADQIFSLFHHFGAVERPAAFRLLVPSWELERFPPEWVPALDAVDAIWASTRFIANSISRVTSTPVYHARQLLDFEPGPRTHERSDFGIPDKSFVVYTAFDFLSYMERKNPMAAIAAFRKAARADAAFRAQATLFIKTTNGNAAEADFLRLHREIADLPQAIVLDARLANQASHDLMRLSDCVISLHRSEGQGLLTSDAMAFELPVIATGYSATVEQLAEDRGYLVDHTMVPVKPGEYPLSEGAVWADADTDHAAELLLKVFHHPKEARERTARAKQWLRQEHGLDAIGRHYAELLERL